MGKLSVPQLLLIILGAVAFYTYISMDENDPNKQHQSTVAVIYIAAALVCADNGRRKE